ncbi:MAG: hypothetical protein V3V78_04230 [Candidatus Woesearchaeota archaeon]
MIQVINGIEKKIETLHEPEQIALSAIVSKSCKKIIIQVPEYSELDLPLYIVDFSKFNLEEGKVDHKDPGSLIGLDIKDSHIVGAGFYNCDFDSVPEEMQYLTELREMCILYGNLNAIHGLKWNCPNLETLYLGNNPIRHERNIEDIASELSGHKNIKRIYWI